jgi:hypothetical protein
MNERLKQLAIESKLIAPEYNGFDHTRLSISQQKFAELIVRECGVALSPMLRDMVSRGQAYDLIKKHFGVEE